MRARGYDVLIATDLRRPGGTTSNVAEEVEIQARMGLKTGIVPIEPPHDASGASGAAWPERIQSLVAAGLAEVVGADQAATARLLLLRDPRVFERTGWALSARADHVVMVADRLPRDGARDEAQYDVATVLDRLIAELGAAPAWAPVGPMVREALVRSGQPRLELTPDDWHPVVDADAWAPRQPRQPRVRRAAAVIGRHSRDDVTKWPEKRADLLRAYPDGAVPRVRILGGARAARHVLRRRPRAWDVLPFGSLDPADFLAGLDVYVYFHHSGWREPFARSVLEALASGLPVLTHPYLEASFGDTCRYCEPADSPPIVEQLLRDSEGGPNQRGIELVRERFDWEEHRRRLLHYLAASLSSIARRSARRRRVLFFSSNGGGMGHLTRLLAMARRLPDDCEPLFLTQSTGIEAVGKLGFWVDYVPSREKSGLDRWHPYLRSRLAAAMSAFRPDALVFDGTFAYKGLLQAMAAFPQVHRIWSRRAMWKPVRHDRVRRSFEQLAAFDVVLEPGELAAQADQGITAQQRHLVRTLEPIVLLDGSEVPSREDARNELGIARGEVAALLNLGAGNINRIDTVLAEVADMLAQHAQVRLFAMQSLISKRALPVDAARISRIETYPLARLLRAFDFCIAAPGYNSFHELLASAVPTIFVPNEETDVDDQPARAAWAADRGLALMSRADDRDQLRRAIASMLDPDVRRALADRCRDHPAGFDGARQAADIIAAEISSRPDRSRRTITRGALREPFSWVPSFLRQGASQLSRQLQRMGGREQTIASAPSRPLVLADGAVSADATMEELIAWVQSRHDGAVILAAAEGVASLSRRGMSVELMTRQDAQDVADRLDLAAYARQKTAALVTAYGCGPPVQWPPG